MPENKLYSLTDAVARFVADGSEVALGVSQETLIPFAAGHEIMRQQKRDLTLIGPISDILFDQMIGGGCVRRIRAAWVGNVITGSGYNFRRAVESGAIEMEDHSNLTLMTALLAGALGVPFMPTRTALGSDLFKTNPSLLPSMCPFSGEKLVAVRAIHPDVAIIHVQRADRFGNAHLWGNLGIAREAAMASRRIILTAEEIVTPEKISSDPNRVLLPGFRVNAVVHAPWGAHPSPVPGYYNRDHQTFIDYRSASTTPRRFATWKSRWVISVRSSEDYLNLLGGERLEKLAITHSVRPEPVDYGY
ncbi:MAG: CoA-transferase [Thermodesulfobacteriota bacterium]